MFSFFSKKDSSKDAFSFLGTDMHSHLLPGIDDGSDSLLTSLTLIDGLKHLGFSKLIITPHIYEAFYKNSKQTIEPAYKEVKTAFYASVELEYSAEYFADEFFERKVKDNDLLPFSKNHILIETSFVAYTQRIEHIVFKLKTQGYQPILAHPERYLHLKDSFETFKRLKEFGCLFQLNTISLGGYYGRASEEMAFDLMEAGFADYLGTDMHHARHLDFLKVMANKKRLMQKLREYDWKNKLL
jgi:protein-tyrosine phosphatase